MSRVNMRNSLGKMISNAIYSKHISKDLLHYRQLEESYLNQYSDSEEEVSDVDEIEEGVENCDLSGGEEVIDDELYCVACNKFFNSESAKLNHEASKKHKQNIEVLKMEMKAEEESYQEKLSNDIKEPNSEQDENENESDDVEEEPAKKSKSKKSKKKNKKPINYEISDPEPEQEIETKVEENLINESNAIDSEENDWSNSKKAKKTKAKAKPKSEKVKPSEPELKEVILVEMSPSQETNVVDSTEYRCATCKEIFPSKNKLFAHLKKTNHSIYLGDSKVKVNSERTNLKKKK